MSLIDDAIDAAAASPQFSANWRENHEIAVKAALAAFTAQGPVILVPTEYGVKVASMAELTGWDSVPNPDYPNERYVAVRVEDAVEIVLDAAREVAE